MDKVYEKDFRKDFGLRKPRYRVGEVVYIKEAWRVDSISDDWLECLITYGDGIEIWKEVPDDLAMYYYNHYFKAKRKPSPLFMPAWAARDFGLITSVRAERLQEITSRDCEAEGFPFKGIGATLQLGYRKPLVWYQTLWDSINSKYPWESNCWVWVYGFKLAPS